MPGTGGRPRADASSVHSETFATPVRFRSRMSELIGLSATSTPTAQSSSRQPHDPTPPNPISPPTPNLTPQAHPSPLTRPSPKPSPTRSPHPSPQTHPACPSNPTRICTLTCLFQPASHLSSRPYPVANTTRSANSFITPLHLLVPYPSSLIPHPRPSSLSSPLTRLATSAPHPPLLPGSAAIHPARCNSVTVRSRRMITRGVHRAGWTRWPGLCCPGGPSGRRRPAGSLPRGPRGPVKQHRCSIVAALAASMLHRGRLRARIRAPGRGWRGACGGRGIRERETGDPGPADATPAC